MDIEDFKLGRVVFVVGAIGVAAMSVAGSACSVGVKPRCMIHCFRYTIEYEEEHKCDGVDIQDLTISFNSADLAGYRGESCINNGQQSIRAIDAMRHINSGGSLFDLSLNSASRDGYFSTIESVLNNLENECIIAAPGQCVNAQQVCSGIRSQAYQELVVEEVATLGRRVDSYALGFLEECSFIPAFPILGTDGTTSGQQSGGEVEMTTSGGNDGASDTTGGDDAFDESSDESEGVVPSGDFDTLVECEPHGQCEVKREFLDHLEVYLESFSEEGVTLRIVDDTVPCGPGVQIGGLDPGKSARQLADILDLHNGDIIREVESISIKSILDAAEVITSLSGDPSTSMVLWRPDGSYCSPRFYRIDVL